jgi:hypothetical protein
VETLNTTKKESLNTSKKESDIDVTDFDLTRIILLDEDKEPLITAEEIRLF